MMTQHHHDKPKSLPTIKRDRASDTIKEPSCEQRRNHLQLKGSIHLATVRTPGDARLQHWRCLWEVAQSTTKMSTPSKSRSSAREEEGYFEWRETMERRQLESERKMQALFQETTRLREENAVLRIQVSSSGPLRDQRPRG
ncbi:hypothetical protein CK203_092640 [Vitis vinifera]|uniref:Uncharacterized protein n=1 Tax=Vitis vinifera TaxID=29760 RepID=A0A438BV53_VITVI|nr:hypothetical protein CK203_092640 [Vitis vinifera]